MRSWQGRDPIARLEAYLGHVAPDALEALAAAERAWESEIDRKLEQIEPVPAPPRESLFDDVYAKLPWHLREQRDELLALEVPPPSPR